MEVSPAFKKRPHFSGDVLPVEFQRTLNIERHPENLSLLVAAVVDHERSQVAAVSRHSAGAHVDQLHAIVLADERPVRVTDECHVVGKARLWSPRRIHVDTFDDRGSGRSVAEQHAHTVDLQLTGQGPRRQPVAILAVKRLALPREPVL